MIGTARLQIVRAGLAAEGNLNGLEREHWGDR